MSVFPFSTRRQDQQRHPQPYRSPPGLELLEDRALFSTLTVLNTLDSGPGSLRDAIAHANAQLGLDIIHFQPGLTGTVDLPGGELTTTDDLTIQGPGAANLTLRGNPLSRVLKDDAGATEKI